MEEVIFNVHIDSAPENRHQEELGRKMFEILGQEYRKPDFTFFGDWTWENIKSTKDKQKEIGKMLCEAYDRGDVRYAEWAQN